MYPIFLDQNPQKNSIEIQRNTNVFFRIEDDDGINLSTLKIIFEGLTIYESGSFQPGYTGSVSPEDPTPKAVSVVVNPDVDFAYGQEVNVASSVEDNLGNTGNDYYKFLTIPNPDHTAPEVVADPHGDIFNAIQNVTLTASEANVTIHYTTDGTEPNIGSTIYTVPIQINSGTTTLKFFGIDDAGNSGVIRTEVYNINLSVPTTIANPPGGAYFNSIDVQLISDDLKATIFYTTNGQVPTTSSSVYTTPISIPDNQNLTIKFFAVDEAGNVEDVKTEVYNSEIAKNNYIVTNTFVICPFITGMLEVRWDDMYPIFTNIIGYNIYRADVETGPYQKLNNNLVSITYYQDKTLDTEIIKEDVSDQFKRTVSINTEVNDNFDTPRFDITKWKQVDVAELLFQYNGVLFVDKAGIKRDAKLTSIFKLRGDFDIQVNYNLINWNEPVSAIQSNLFRVKKDDNNFVQIGRERSQTANVYNANQFINGNPDLPISVSTNDDYGTYRITRSGNIITVYFLDNNTDDFVVAHTFTAYEDDLYVELAGISADVPIETRLAQFVLKSGNPIIVEPKNPLLESVIQVDRIPIVDSSGTGKPTDDESEVNVTIDGIQAYIKKLCGKEGLVYLETKKQYDDVKKEYFEPPVPDENSKVLITYKTKQHTTKVALRKKYFYKVTSVTLEDETDLDLIEPTVLAPEKNTWIFTEAIRRNHWLLDQVGERVLLFPRKKAGEVCPCTLRDVKVRSHRRADQDCDICYSSGFVGGYDGPFPIIIAPLTTEQRITQSDRGLNLKYQIETWTGPIPIIAQRDLIVRRNCDRCLTGPITPAEGPGGVILQQHFTIENLDTTDIRYKFPIQPLPNQTMQPGIDKAGITVAEIDSPKEREELITSEDKTVERNVNVDKIVRGRSITFENKHY